MTTTHCRSSGPPHRWSQPTRLLVVELSKPRGQAASDDANYDQVTDTDRLPGIVEFEFVVK